MKNTYTAAIQEDQGCWFGWVEEIPGVNSQGDSQEELLENLKSALAEAIEFNREDARALAGKHSVEAIITL